MTIPPDFDPEAEARLRAKLQADMAKQSDVEPQTLRDAAENLLIAIGMGWDIEGCVENLRAALATPPCPDVSAGMSWSGFNVYGDKKSINAVRDALHAKDRCEALDKMIGEKQLVRPDTSAGLIETAEFTDQLFSLAFDRCEIDTYEIMELGEKLGLLEQVAYDPKIHEGEIDADEGDMIYVRSAKGKALRARAADRSGNGPRLAR